MDANRNGFFYVLDRTNGRLLAANPYVNVNWASHIDLESGRPVETDVTKPIEYAINTVSGVSLIRSNSWDGRSDVFAEFRMSTDMNRAMQLLHTKEPKELKEPK